MRGSWNQKLFLVIISLEYSKSEPLRFDRFLGWKKIFWWYARSFPRHCRNVVYSLSYDVVDLINFLLNSHIWIKLKEFSTCIMLIARCLSLIIISCCGVLQACFLAYSQVWRLKKPFFFFAQQFGGDRSQCTISSYIIIRDFLQVLHANFFYYF